jgi:hypothetical protein
MADKFWVGGTDDWDSTSGSKWSATSGGSGGAARPGSSDVAIFDANSGSGTVTKTTNTSIQGLNFSGFTGTFAGSSNISLSGTGDLTMGSGMTNSYTGNLTLAGTSAVHNITTNGITLAGTLTINGSSSTNTLQDNLTMTNGLSVTRGTFDANDNDISVSWFNANSSLTKTLIMGSGTWTISGGGTTLWIVGTTGTTITPETSTIKLTGLLTANRNFTGGGFTYNNIWNATTGAFAVAITDSNTFNDFKINAARIQRFNASTTTTVTTFDAIGTSGNEITIESSSGTNHSLVKSGGGTIDVEYCTISNSDASPVSTWLAPTNLGNTDDGGGNTGWVFTANNLNNSAMMGMVQISGGLV